MVLLAGDAQEPPGALRRENPQPERLQAVALHEPGERDEEACRGKRALQPGCDALETHALAQLRRGDRQQRRPGGVEDGDGAPLRERYATQDEL